METTPYMTVVSDQRALLLDEQDSLEGSTTIRSGTNPWAGTVYLVCG
jgi:hypothetical protein